MAIVTLTAGACDIGNIKIGSTQIKKVYVGSSLVWQQPTYYAIHGGCSFIIAANGNVYITPSGNGTMASYNWNAVPWSAYYGNASGACYVRPGVVALGDHALYCCAIKSISIPSTVTTIGREVFAGCGSLTSLTIPDTVTSFNTYRAFEGCGFDNFLTPKAVTAIPSAFFYNSTNLKTVKFNSTVTSITSGCFYNCPLTTVYWYGNPPTLSGTPFAGMTLTMYYKTANTKWTSSVRTATYGGATKVTWKTFT